ncbi:uncharacterized protein K02A2.6-like [Corticium candelabrum]|uniref:uncharacterized protein K02A2.6-like n=1 Tax=Corticium candelabrum TaxID=121492 RepID=UPI002E266F58|nr:uncharacterized protein K02A2.6-like [Corticium candelabrum]
MATGVGLIRLEPPGPFNFRQPDDWPRWKRRFTQFRIASGLADADEVRQVSTLLYCMGEDVEGVLTSTNITEDNKKKYDEVIAKFEEFFRIRRNVIYERARFNRRNELEGESIEQYITALYELVETCEYGGLQQEMLRDRIVVGIRDQALSERLQCDAELTLEKVKRSTRQREAVKEQHKHLQGDGSKDYPIVIEQVRNGAKSGTAGGKSGTTGGKSQASRHQFGGGRSKSATPPARHQCKRCGRYHAKEAYCPARQARCSKCNRKGHFGAQCFSKTIETVDSESRDGAYVFPVNVSKRITWSSKISVGGKELTFKLDTGAEVTVITEEAHRMLEMPKLQKPSKALYGPTSTALRTLGQFTSTLSVNSKTSEETIFVVQGLKTNLLGLPAITSLQLVHRIQATSVGTTIPDRSPKVFQGLGNLCDPYKIKLREGAKPYALYTPRNVPISLRQQVKEELDRMEKIGVISQVEDPTEWCAGMVVVRKKTGDVRICVDMKPLNENVLREIYPIPKVDDTLAQLAGATTFSKIDANSGFWQIPLEVESRLLTTFVTPHGRYCFNKLPFGIASAPELFQRRMSKILSGLPGVLCHMDDVLIFGTSQTEHDDRLTSVLQRLQAAGATLNKAKCEFGIHTVKFLGHIIDGKGLRADPARLKAIQDLEQPKNVSELRRFMGMANQLGKFSPHLSEISQPLRELLSTRCSWLWEHPQEQAFTRIKDELTRPTVLELYNPQKKVKVSADASSHGLGAVLLQEAGDKWKPIAYASRSMTDTEKRYAQIEKEALSLTWACDKFQDYVLGRKFHIETDHKPLVPLLSTKHLDRLPPRIVRFRLRLARYDFTIEHVPGKLLYTADTLSRAPLQEQITEDSLQDDVETFINEVVANLPTTTDRLQTYREAQARNATCAQVMQYSESQWPDKCPEETSLIPFWRVRSLLTVHNDLLLYNNRVVIPDELRKDVLTKIHEGHQGIVRCRQRAHTSVWWPRITQQIYQLVQQCPTCAKENPQRTEPLMTSQLPDFPWQVVATDLMELNGAHYLVVIDYFSRYPELIKLTSTTALAVIQALKSVFARHGIPDILRSDNGPQYIARETKEFAKAYGFVMITSSPRYPQSNGLVERMVKSIKQLLTKAEDPHLGLLAYRSTPLPWCTLSPSELLMGRRLRTTMPQSTAQLTHTGII